MLFEENEGSIKVRKVRCVSGSLGQRRSDKVAYSPVSNAATWVAVQKVWFVMSFPYDFKQNLT